MAGASDVERPRSPEVATPWSAAPFVPDATSLEVLSAAAAGCEGCPLYAPATQTVFGEGPTRARLMLVGEQPGDAEDRAGHPFVGPAGRLLWACVDEAGADARCVYTTNAVKHFKFSERGKRRIHQRPRAGEIDACNPWLRAELQLVHPDVIVALGATAIRAVLGRALGIAEARAVPLHLDDRPVVATYHPSAILRAADARESLHRALVDDLARAWALTDA